MKNFLTSDKLKYLVFFSSLVLIFVVYQYFVQKELEHQLSFAEVINEAGSQRMRSQKISKLSLSLFYKKANYQPLLSHGSTKELNRLITEFKETDMQLLKFSKNTIQDPALTELQIKASIQLDSIVKHVALIIENDSIPNLTTALKKMARSEEHFLPLMNEVVDLYQKTSDQNLEKLKQTELVLSIIAIIAIIVIFLYVLRTMLRKEIESNRNLKQVNDDLIASEEEIKANLEYLSAIKNELEQKDELMATFIKNAPNAIAMFDKEMRYIISSGKWNKVYGLNGTDIIGKSHYKILPEMEKPWKAIHEKCLRGAIDQNKGTQFINQNGDIQWISWDIRPWYNSKNQVGGLIILTNDITALKQTQLENERIYTILEDTNKIARIGTWEVDLIKGTVFWSDITKEIHEVEKDYVPDLEKGIEFYEEGYSRDKIQELINNAINHGESFDEELLLRTIKGNTIWVRSIGQAEIVGNQCTRLYGVFQDINQNKVDRILNEKNRKELDELTVKLKDQNRQLSDFVQITSHNLRAPVSNLNSLMRMLDICDTEEEKNEVMEKFSIVVTRLTETLNTLVETLKIKENRNQPKVKVPFNNILERVKQMMSSQISESNTTIESDFSQIESIEYNPIYMESLFLNLISNAIKYRSVNRDPIIKIKSKIIDDKINLIFADNGSGIDLNKYGDKIFKLNKTFHRNKDAKGLGLFMTKSQIEVFGGTITVESEVEEGTTFTIIF